VAKALRVKSPSRPIDCRSCCCVRTCDEFFILALNSVVKSGVRTNTDDRTKGMMTQYMGALFTVDLTVENGWLQAID
jgi:hypothetical protein